MGGVVSMLQGWMGVSSGDKGSKAEEDAERKRRLRENVAFDDHKIPVEELLERTGANLETGFSTAEAKRRNEEIGLNQLTPPAETPLWVKFIQEMTGFFSLLLWGGSLLCFISFSIRQDLENLYLGIVLAVVVFTTGVFSFYQNSKSEQLMKSFQALEAPPVTTLRDGERKAVESKFLCKGDIVTLNAGDVVPADVRILECTDDTVVDNAALTGESEPQKRRPEASDDNPLETANLAFFGTTVPNGSLTGIIVNIGDDTVMGKIAALTLTTEDEQTPINAEIEHFIHIISAIAIFLGVSFFAIGFGFGQDITSALVFMIGIIVANVPEGLLATVTVSLTLTAVKMYKKQVRVKNLEGVETLGSTSCICSDKTGTLTQNIMTVAQIVYGGASGFNIEDCASSFTRGNKTYDENNPSFKKLQRCATLCNTAFFEPTSMTDPETGEKKPFLAQVLQGDGSFITQVAWEPAQGCNASEVAMIKFTQPLRDVLEYRNRCPIIKDATIPFNSKNKYQVHVHCQEEYQPEGSTSPEDNTGPRIVCMKGAPERVIGRCSHALVNGELVQMTAQLKEEIAELQLQLSENGLRVLGFAEKEMPLNQYPPDFVFEPNPAGFSTANYPLGEFMNHQGESKDDQKEGDPPHPNSLEGLVFLGLMALVDPPRPAVPGAVNKCKTAGIKVIMVTGDHPITAQAIAYKVGILWSKTKNIMELENKRYNRHPGDAGWQDPDDARAIVVPGHTIDAEMGEDKWDAILEHPQIVFARTSPQQKLIIVENCKRVGHIVAVTGDGVNDAPALKAANIGVAMGITGTEVSKRAADMILLDDNFASIVNGVEEGRLIFDNLKKSICYTLTSNIPEITPFLAFIVLAIPLPLSTVLILAIDLGTDMVPAISMAYEEAEADIMKRPPRNAKVDRLVTSKLIILAYLQIGVMQAAAGFYTYMVVLNDYGFPPHILLGLGAANNWQRQPLFCRFSGGRYVDPDGNIDLTRDPTNDAPSLQFPLWDSGADGYVIDCQHPLKNLEGGSGLPGGFEFDEVDTYDAAETLRESLITAESIQALEADGYYYYVPWRARMSPFWNENWLNWDIEDVEAPGGSLGGAADILYFANQPAGLWSICAADPGLQSESKTPAVGPEESRIRGGNYVACDAGVTTSLNAYRKAFFCNGDIEENYNTEQFPDIYTQCAMFDDFALNLRYCERRCDWQCVRDSEFVSSAGRTAENNDDFNQCANIASRMTQKEALHHAQGAFFVTIVIVQWADLLICKTRWLSIRAQGMRNQVMNFGLYFETVLAAFLCYIPAINLGLGTRNIRLTHWFPGMPWSMLIFVYDELRKYLMRSTSPEVFDKATGQVTRVKGWIERFTYY